MKSKNSNLMKVMGVLFIAAIILSVTIPANAAPIVDRPLSISPAQSTGSAVAADSFYVSTANLSSLSTPAREANVFEAGGDSREQFIESYGGSLGSFQIPRGSLSANRPNTFGGAVSESRPGMLPPPTKKDFEIPMPSVDFWWNGLNQGANRTMFGYGVYPPDTNGAIGDGYYVQTVNSTFAVWDLTQANAQGIYPKTVYGPQKISTLWKGTNDGVCDVWDDGDPIVLYDEGLGVWLITQFSITDGLDSSAPPFYQCVAVSQTSNPLGMWNLYRFSFPVLNDYPHFGVWEDGYYMSINQFSAPSFGWEGQGVAVFERALMSSAVPTTADDARMIYINTYDDCTSSEPQCFLGGMLPSDTDGDFASAGVPNYFMAFDDDAWGYSPDQLQLWAFDTDWGAGTGTFTYHSALPVDPFDSEVCPGYARNCIPQPGTAAKLDAIGDRLMYRLQFRKFDVDTPVVGEPAHYTLVVNHTVDADGSNSGYAGIRWYELQSQNVGSTWSVHQQGTLAPDSRSRWMGSAAMDRMGNIAVGYSVSGSTFAPNMAYSGRLFSDPLNTLPRTEQFILSTLTAAGSQTGTGSRWGDYSMLDVDPDSGCEFFFTSQYLRGTTDREWYTAIGAFGNSSCYNGDVTSPTATTIDVYPADPSQSPPAPPTHFEFSNVDPSVVGFECSLDNGPWVDCSSGSMDYASLTPGSHTFYVRAYDINDNFEDPAVSYTWTVIAPIPLNSIGNDDGWVLESGKNTNKGGSRSNVGSINIGDDKANREFRGILSFNTSSIPDNAVITQAILKIRQNGATVGTNPFSVLGNLSVDIKKGLFGGQSLENGDWQSGVSQLNALTIPNAPDANKWYTATTTLSGFISNINKTGITQLRLRFSNGDNNNAKDNYIKFYDGSSGSAPQLIIEYYIP